LLSPFDALLERLRIDNVCSAAATMTAEARRAATLDATRLLGGAGNAIAAASLVGALAARARVGVPQQRPPTHIASRPPLYADKVLHQTAKVIASEDALVAFRALLRAIKASTHLALVNAGLDRLTPASYDATARYVCL
jgi:hypothetical protein